MAHQPNYYYETGEVQTAGDLLKKLDNFRKACKVLELEGRKIGNTANSKSLALPRSIEIMLIAMSFTLRHLDAEVTALLKGERSTEPY